jgi:NADH:ubiquinone oxidoreductase subunit E
MAASETTRHCPLKPDGSLEEPMPSALATLLEEQRQRGCSPLDVLRAMQARFGYLSERYLRHAATFLHCTRFALQRLLQADPSFLLEPPGLHRVRVCRAESCSDEGSKEIMELLEHQLGLAPDETTPNCHFSLETVYCFGMCSDAPVVEIDGIKHRRVTPDRVWQAVQDVVTSDDP